MASLRAPFRIGNSGVSALLRSASNVTKTAQDYQDKLAAYQWENSAKTYSDFVDYTKYLQDQIPKAPNESAALTITGKINSAYKGYTSNEIQRQSIDVIEGRQSNTDKYKNMASLYYQAVDSGNYDLAQSLNLQLDNLSVTLQNEAEAAQSLAGKLSSLRAKSVDDAIDTLKGYTKDLNDQFSSLGQKEFNKQIKGYADQLGTSADFFGVYGGIVKAITGVYQDAMASESDPDNLRKFQKEYNSFLTSNDFELPGGVKVSAQDIVDQIDANRVGEQLFSLVESGGKTIFRKNKEQGYVWGRDENGNYRIITTYSPTGDDFSKSNTYQQNVIRDKKGNIVKVDYLGKDENGNTVVVATKDKNGKVTGVNGRSLTDASRQGYKDLLQQAGFNVSEDNGKLTVYGSDKTGPLNIPGLEGDQGAEAFVDQDGNLQIRSGDKLYNVKFDDQGKYTGIEETRPSSITMLNDRFSADFLRKLDYNKLGPGAIGVVDTNQANSYLKNIKNFGDIGGVTAPGLNTPASILQSSASIQQTLKAQELQRATEAAQLQRAAPAPNIQPTANPFALPAQPYLKVAAPNPTPKVTVAPPAPTPKISSVGVATNVPRITGVGVR